MARELVKESRNDFRGGLNVYISPDLLSPNELSTSPNMRVDTDGPITRRNGSRRIHATALAAAPVKGVAQWDGPSGSQIVAICNGDLFYRNQSSGEYAAFTQVDPGTTDAFSTTSPAIFSTLRGTDSGAPLRLYIASGGKLYEWTGTTLTRLDMASTGTTGVYGPDASLLATYHLRIFTNSVNRPQNLVWSRLGDGRNYKAGLSGDGGTAMLSAIEADPIVNLQSIGRSLLAFTNNSIARIAGYSASDIQIDQDTEGLSFEVGTVGALSAIRADRIIFFMSDRGPYLATEDAIAPVGLKVLPLFDAMDRTQLSNIVVGHHHERSEIWVAYSGPNDSSLNCSVLVYNLRHQAWYGPFNFSFVQGTVGITCFETYEQVNGHSSILAGCTDGFIRNVDINTKDDVLSDGSGGDDFAGSFTLAPFFFGHPEQVHSTRYVFCQARLATSSSLFYSPSVNPGIGTTPFSVVGNTATFQANGLLNYKSWPEGRYVNGQRLTLQFATSAGTQPELHGVTVYAHMLNRTY